MGVIRESTGLTEQGDHTCNNQSNTSATVGQNEDSSSATASTGTCSSIDNSTAMITSTNTSANISHSLSMGIDPKLKGRIWEGQFIEFHSLINNQENSKMEVVERS